MKVLIASAAMADQHGFPRNVGDEALTDGLALALSRRGHDVIATLGGDWDRVPEGQAGAPRVRANTLPTLQDAVRSADHVLIGGGTLLAQNVPPLLGVVPRGLVRWVSAVSTVARVMRVPYSFIGVGAESWPKGPSALALTIAVRGAAKVGVRDPDSARLVQERTGVNALVTGDTFFGHPVPSPLGGARQDVALVALSGRTSETEVNEAVHAAHAISSNILVVRMDQAGDDAAPTRFAVACAERLGAAVEVLPYQSSWTAVHERISSASAVVASRLHALIMAAHAGTPALAVGQNSKVRTFCSDSGTPHISEERTPSAADARYLHNQGLLLRDYIDSLF